MSHYLTHFHVRRRESSAVLLLVAALVLGSCTLAGEPVPDGPIERVGADDLAPTLVPPPTVELPPDLGYPVEMPDAAGGASLYAARCAACHGPDGSGQGGQMAATLAEQGVTVPNFTDPALARQRTPQEYFQVITEGNLEAFMPPWGQELTEAERWNLTFYLYTLTTPPEVLDAGQAVYEANCAGCHGAGGQGDGPQAAGPVPDLTDRATAVTQASGALYEVVTNGAGAAMPAYAETLSEQERWAVVDYVRTFTYQPLPIAEPQAEAAPVTLAGTVSGTVTNQTTGAALGEGQPVRLHGLIVAQNDLEEILTLETTTDAQGNFVFEDVPMDQEHLIYVADMVYEGIDFNNTGFVTPGETTSLELPINVYDVTQDPSVIRVETLHVVVSPQAEDTVLIAQIYVFSNTSGSAYVSNQAITETRRGTIKLPVPPEAVSLAFEDGQLGGRYVETTGGVLDTAAVLPGSQTHSAVMTYLLPYGGEYTLTIPVLYSMDQVSVLYEETGMRVGAEGLAPSETGDPELDQFEILAGQGFSAGDEIVITLKGRPGAATPVGNVGLFVAAGVAVLVLVVAGVVLSRRGRGKSGRADAPRPASRPVARQGRRRELMQAIADLDDAHEAGRIGTAQYEAQRARLKAELVALVEEEGGA